MCAHVNSSVIGKLKCLKYYVGHFQEVASSFRQNTLLISVSDDNSCTPKKRPLCLDVSLLYHPGLSIWRRQASQ